MFIKGARYQAEQPYDDDYPEFGFYEPVSSGDFHVCDCYVVDKDGNRCPEYDTPVPVRHEDLGEMVQASKA